MFYIGIALEKEEFKVAVLKKEKKSIVVSSVQTFPLGSDNVKLFYNLPPFHTGKKVKIVSGLLSSEVFIRKLHLPLREKRKVFDALPFQLETLVPFPAENTIVCPLLKTLSKQMTSITLVATVKEHLFSHLSGLKNLDIEPSHVSCVPAAMARFAQWQFQDQRRVLAFQASVDQIVCTIVEAGELVLSQTVPFDFKDNLAFELDKLFVFLKQKGVIEEQTPWVLTGDPSFAEMISRIFPGQQLHVGEPAHASYAIPIGLALDALKADGQTIQFCQKEFTSEGVHHARKKKLSIYLGVCFAAMVLMATTGSLMLGKKQRALADRLQTYLSPAVAKGTLSSVEEIEQKLLSWEKSLQRQKTPFSFLPTVPKVSDVLAWISAHPAFSTEEGGKKEGMEIKSLHYSLVKYPKIGDASSPYLAQMELEFTSAAPRSARDFHEALLKGDQIVNAKKEIKWQTQNQTYNTSFELNKGVSP